MSESASERASDRMGDAKQAKPQQGYNASANVRVVVEHIHVAGLLRADTHAAARINVAGQGGRESQGRTGVRGGGGAGVARHTDDKHAARGRTETQPPCFPLGGTAAGTPVGRTSSSDVSERVSERERQSACERVSE